MEKIEWQLAPHSPALVQAEVHVWRANLHLSEPQLKVANTLATPAEIERASRMVTDVLRNRRIAAQSILRDILSRYLPEVPREIIFTHGERGKPSIQNSDIEFNMTHTEDVALVALTLLRPIGVDVEFIKTSKYHDSIVEKNYSPQELAQYQALEESQKLEAFFRAWTRKEAYIKAIGLGLYYPLEKFTVDLTSTSDKGLLSIEGSTERASSWLSTTFWAADDYMASVAIEAQIRKWQFFDWQDFTPRSHSKTNN